MSIAEELRPNSDLVMTSVEMWGVAVEEIEGIRRHAAEIGDYAKAERWLRIEQRVAARISTPVTRGCAVRQPGTSVDPAVASQAAWSPVCWVQGRCAGRAFG